MDNKKQLKDIASVMGKATLWTAEKTAKATSAAVEYTYDHRADIAKGAGLAVNAGLSSVKGAAQFAYDTAALKIFLKKSWMALRVSLRSRGDSIVRLLMIEIRDTA